MNLPIITLEVGSMRNAISVALAQQQFQMDAYVKEALDKVCSEENIRTIVMRSVADTLTAAIEEEVKAFYRYGDGRTHIAKLVCEKLKKEHEL